MTHNDFIGIIVTLIISLILIILGIILIKGKGAFLISGYNTLSLTEKKKYNEKLLCRCVGIILIIIAGLLSVGIISAIFQIYWIYFLAFLAIPAICVTMIIHINLSKKFKQ